MRLHTLKFIELYTFNVDYFIQYCERLVAREALLLEMGLWTKPPIGRIGDQEIMIRAWNSLTEPPNIQVTDAQFMTLTLRGESVSITKTQEFFTEAEDSLRHLEAKGQTALTGPSDAAWNKRVEVHIPGQALTVYNEVCNLDDSCTDALQSYLEKGWRIIAACPQPDQRRPDYILGRYNPNA